jgi:hypothetical protein
MPVHTGTVKIEGVDYPISAIVTQATALVTGEELRKLSAVFMHPEAVRMIRVWIKVEGRFDDPSFPEGMQLREIFNTYIRGRLVHSLFAEQSVGTGTRTNVKYGGNQKQDRVSGKVGYSLNIASIQVTEVLELNVFLSKTP